MSEHDQNKPLSPSWGILKRPRKRGGMLRQDSGEGSVHPGPLDTVENLRSEHLGRPSSALGGAAETPTGIHQTDALADRLSDEAEQTLIGLSAGASSADTHAEGDRSGSVESTPTTLAVDDGTTNPRVPDTVNYEDLIQQSGSSSRSENDPPLLNDAVSHDVPEPSSAKGATLNQATQGGGTSGELRLSGYEVIRFFGKGGMGEVFLADRLSSTGVRVRCVVKTIKEGLGNQAQFEDLFLDEARIISELRHPNITSVVDVGRENGRLYMAMEWIDGVDASGLAKKAAIRGGDIPLPHLLYILRETLQGLHYAHTAKGTDGSPLNLVHRDISQGNILISKHGAVKLADFGVAIGSNIQTEGSAENLAGKPHYFAPELWRGSRANAGTDVFALAVTFYEMLTAASLFSREKDLRSLAFEICDFRVEELIETELTIPDGLEDILLRALNENPAERYQSALEFLEDVNDYAYEYGIRLLDVHFGEYVARMIEEEVTRSSLWKE